MFNPLFRQSFKQYATHGARFQLRSFATTVTRSAFAPSTKFIFGAAASVITLHTLKDSKILNESAFASNPIGQISSNVKSVATDTPASTGFGGRVNYNELTIGSITGLFLGIIAGKLSSAIVFLALSGYFLTQFLESRGIISIPWGKVIHIGSETIDLKSLVLEKPSFKVPFVLTFLIAAYNI